MSLLPELPRANGPPIATGVIRAQAEDFAVDELLGFEPDGEGEHALVLVQKTHANTAWVARALARHAGVASRDVSYAGLKDRHALVTQWFSVRLAGQAAPCWDSLEVEGVRVLRSARHRRKLRRGSHAANVFTLTVRDLQAGEEDLERLCTRVAVDGVPNYFGPQRYGRGARNLEVARAMFAGRVRPRDRTARSMALSAARSLLFDTVLAERVRADTWRSLEDGDVAGLDGTASWFPVAEVSDELRARVARRDIHPTGPMWGRGRPPSGAGILALEQSVADAHETFAQGLEKCGFDQDRRALRVVPDALEWERAGDRLTLSFRLPPGAYATTVLRELVDVRDAAIPGDSPDAGPGPARALREDNTDNEEKDELARHS